MLVCLLNIHPMYYMCASVCNESRKRAVRLVETGAKEALQAFALAVVAHVDKLLTNLLSKYDYAPKVTSTVLSFVLLCILFMPSISTIYSLIL